MDTQIPDWVIKYNEAGYTSGAGKAVKLLMEKVEKLEAERSELIRRIKSILKASTVHDKISIIEELEQLLNSLKTK